MYIIIYKYKHICTNIYRYVYIKIKRNKINFATYVTFMKNILSQ